MVARLGAQLELIFPSERLKQGIEAHLLTWLLLPCLACKKEKT